MRWWLVALVACAHAAPASPSQPDDRAIVRADIDRAEKAELARQHDVARAEYEHAIADARTPQSQAYARRELAETLDTWGEVAEATAQLEAAVAVMPGDVIAWHDLGLHYHKQGDDTRALSALERAKQLAPRDPRPRIAIALLHWCHDDRASASAEYRGLLELELPDRIRDKVRWALDQLAKPAAPLHCS